MFIFIAFLFALVPLLICPVACPHLRLTFFAPFLVLICYKRPLDHCLWYALGCGLIMDLLAAQGRLGFYAVNYTVTTWVLYHQKKHFFEDSITTLPFVTLLFALISTLLQVITMKSFGYPIALSWHWAATDLFLLPLADAFYALVWFAIPAYLLRRRPSQGRDNTLSFRKR